MGLYPPPFAGVLCQVGSGAPAAGGQTVPSTSTVCTLTAVSTTWQTGLWELVDYPPGYAVPSGWSLNPQSGAIFYSATKSHPNPPTFTLQYWGKIGVRLTVDGGFDPTGAYNPERMVDTTCALSVLSPNAGLEDIFAGEGGQFGGFRVWVAAQKTNLRIIDTLLGGGSITSGDVQVTSGFASLVSIGSENLSSPGSIATLPIYGLLVSQVDSVSLGVTPPTIGTGPGSVGGVTTWAANTIDGTTEYSQDASGATTAGRTATAAFDHNPYNTQALIVGGPVASGSIGDILNDTLTGPSQTGPSSGRNVPAGPSGNSTTHGTITMQMRCVSSGGTTEHPGDMCTIVQEFDAIVISGNVAHIINGTQTKTSYSSSGSTMASATLSVSISGGDLLIQAGTPASFHSDTVVDVSIFVDRLKTT